MWKECIEKDLARRQLGVKDSTSKRLFAPLREILYKYGAGLSTTQELCFCSVLCLLCFVRVCLYVLCGHLLGKG